MEQSYDFINLVHNLKLESSGENVYIVLIQNWFFDLTRILVLIFLLDHKSPFYTLELMEFRNLAIRVNFSLSNVLKVIFQRFDIVNQIIFKIMINMVRFW